MFGKGKIIFSAEPIELYIYFQYYKNKRIVTKHM